MVANITEKNIGTYGISRVDRVKNREKDEKTNKEEHYWYVRIWNGQRKPTNQKTFSDETFGGQIFSLAAAVAYRDKHVDRNRAVLNMPYLENIASELHKANKGDKEAWQKERIGRRLKAIEKFGNNRIYVGYGIDAAKAAREYGASKVTCWKIKTGQQSYYTVWNYIPKAIGKMCRPLKWGDRPTGPLSDINKQKEFGKERVVLGIGLEAAEKAQAMGAGQYVCQRILRGEQDFFNTCWSLPKFEVNGFKRKITPEIADRIVKICQGRIRNKSEALEIASEVMISFASGTQEIRNMDGFLSSSVSKYINIFRKKAQGDSRSREIDINGEIVHHNQHY